MAARFKLEGLSWATILRTNNWFWFWYWKWRWRWWEERLSGRVCWSQNTNSVDLGVARANSAEPEPPKVKQKIYMCQLKWLNQSHSKYLENNLLPFFGMVCNFGWTTTPTAPAPSIQQTIFLLFCWIIPQGKNESIWISKASSTSTASTHHTQKNLYTFPYTPTLPPTCQPTCQHAAQHKLPNTNWIKNAF